MNSPVQKNTTPKPRKNSIDLVFWGTISIFITSLLGSIQIWVHVPLIPKAPTITLGFILGTTVITLTLGKINLIIFRKSIFVFFNIFGLLIFFSTFYSKHPLITASQSLQAIIVLNCLYLLINQIKDTEKLFRYISIIAITLSLIACLYALAIIFFGSFNRIEGTTVTEINFYDLSIMQVMSGRRISSFFGNPNLLGIQLMFSILMSLYLLVTRRNILYLLLIVIFLYVLLLSGSRASMVGLAVGVVFFVDRVFIKENTVSLIFHIFIFSTIFLFTIFLYSSLEILDSISLAVDRKTSILLSGKEIGWNALIEQAKKTRLAGIGYRISTEAVLVPESINIKHSHNIYLAFLVETGVIGLFLMVLFYFSSFYRHSFLKQKKQIDILSIAALSTLLAFLTNQLFEDMYNPLYHYFLASTFCLFIGTKSKLPLKTP